MHQENQNLLRTLQDCVNECNHCYQACFSEQMDMSRCIQLDRQCADICQLAISYVASGAEATHILLEACSQVCAMCAEECEKHVMDHCKRCAEACRRCAEECKVAA